MKYVTNDISGGATTPLSTTWYYYNASGNVERIVTSAEASDVYEATRFGYARNQAGVSFVLGETWQGADPNGTYAITYAREFRCDGARQRYLNRELDPVALQSTGALVTVGDTWTDYDGETAYGDFLVDTGTGAVNNTRSYEPGMATFGWYDDGVNALAVPDPSTVAYLHTDLIGTTRHMTDVNNAQIDPVVYTAFGERIDGTNHRYGYAGAWGYQSHSFGEVSPPLDPDTVFPYLHVGARYYDPASSRFLQRDPIGIGGGFNVYAYVKNEPLANIDPSGLGFSWGGWGSTSPITGCGWLLYEITDRIIKPWLDTWIENDYRRKSDKINHPSPSPPPPTSPPPPPPPPPPCFTTCFIAGTAVETVAGPVNIEDLSIGTRVVSTSQEQSEDGDGRIVRVLHSSTRELVTITLTAETIHVTPEHPFWVVGRGWVTAGALTSNDRLLSVGGTPVPIVNVALEHLSEPVRVYNITVDVFNTFFIGTMKVLVHNKMC